MLCIIILAVISLYLFYRVLMFWINSNLNFFISFLIAYLLACLICVFFYFGFLGCAVKFANSQYKQI